mmetsp:Transcript_12359/g.36304  ORF Transcript_12359/g.36304 Transcript_12359/m.36304 type:complete len:83 (-) Transcript_12359:2211-2459(-)
MILRSYPFCSVVSNQELKDRTSLCFASMVAPSKNARLEIKAQVQEELGFAFQFLPRLLDLLPLPPSLTSPRYIAHFLPVTYF